MATKYISAEELKKHFPKDEDWDCPVNTNSLVCELIDAQPRADVVSMDRYINAIKTINMMSKVLEEFAPVRHGHWISKAPDDNSCSECGWQVWANINNYCPKCGAKMDEVER